MDKLDYGQKHILKLIDRDKDNEGWAVLSNQLYPSFSGSIPKELVEIEPHDDAYRIRLTEAGRNIISAMDYL